MQGKTNVIYIKFSPDFACKKLYLKTANASRSYSKNKNALVLGHGIYIFLHGQKFDYHK